MSANRSPGHEPAGTEPPRRLTLSEIARAQLAALERVPREHSTIGLSRNARGVTQIEVSVRTGDEGVDTLGDALELARKLYDELREAYPLEVEAEAVRVKPAPAKK